MARHSKKVTGKKLMALAASVLATQLIGCAQPTEAPYFDPRLIQRGDRTLAPLDATPSLNPIPSELIDPIGGPGNALAGTTRPSYNNNGGAPSVGAPLGGPGEPTLRLTLQQAIQRAVLYNPDVKVAGYEPAIDASRIVEAEGTFDPVFFANLQFQIKQDQTGGQEFTIPNPNPAATVAEVVESDITKSQIYTGQVGVKQNLASGGQIQVDYDTSYNYLLPQQFVDNPFWQDKVNLQLTQPLLRAFGAQINQAKIYISRNDSKVSLMEFRKTLEQSIGQVEQVYWQLVAIQKLVAADETLLKEYQSSYQLQFNRLQKGLISSLEVSQVQSSLEDARGALNLDRTQARIYSVQLKRLMGDPNLPVSSPVLIHASDEPVTVPLRFDISDEVSAALANRYDLSEKLFKIDSASITYDLARNNTLPKLDLVASVDPNAVDTEFFNTISRQTQRWTSEYSLGLNFEMPLGNREALGILRRTALQRQQTIDDYAATVSQAALEVRAAAMTVDGRYLTIDNYSQSRMAAKRALDDVIERQEKQTEALTPEFVQLRLDLAQKFHDAVEKEDDAIREYNIALEELEQSKGTLLRYYNVVLKEEPYENQGLLK